MARRLVDGPIVGPGTDPSLGSNIQGPSLIRVPSWIDQPLGRYYLYFADHKGSSIRLAYADDVEGPWTVHRPGSLRLADSGFLTEPPKATEAELAGLAELYRALFGEGSFAQSLATDAVTPHIASPDVHVDEAGRRILMYFHGLDGLGIQVSRAAVYRTGIDFIARPEVLGQPYLRRSAMAGGPTRSPRRVSSSARATRSAGSSPVLPCSVRPCGTRPFWCAATSCTCSGPGWVTHPSASCVRRSISTGTGWAGGNPSRSRCCARCTRGKVPTNPWNLRSAAPRTARSTNCGTRRCSRTTGGTVVVAGPRAGAAVPDFDPDHIVLGERRVLGALGVDVAAYRSALELLVSGAYPFASLSRRTVGLAGVSGLLEVMAGGDDAVPPIHGVVVPTLDEGEPS